MGSNVVNLGIGAATGMFFHAPKNTALPAYPTADLSATDWEEVGYISQDGITWHHGRSAEPLKDWSNSIRRRRVCDACKRRFTTYEKIEMIPMIVIKKDNNREPYDRSKIEGGILRACHKRPVSINQIKRVVDEIEKEIYDREEKEISSSEIGELVIKRVHSLDPVAYVRFASVYREFKDVSTFVEELGKLLEQDKISGIK